MAKTVVTSLLDQVTVDTADVTTTDTPVLNFEDETNYKFQLFIDNTNLVGSYELVGSNETGGPAKAPYVVLEHKNETDVVANSVTVSSGVDTSTIMSIEKRLCPAYVAVRVSFTSGSGVATCSLVTTK